ncbi:MAG: hypothetical protein LBJ25_00320 [Candidatus Margulisbacteria bacterium]|jgi:hypothetical protein|nr:hypothetical protein [Candidatus Margulisiibacteriota bacterium]
MQSKFMSNPERSVGTDDSIAKISGNTVEIFGQRFKLYLPFYYKTGELKSFAIDTTVIKFQGREIPIGGRIYLYEDGKFFGATINKEYTWELLGQPLVLFGGITFHHSGALRSVTIKKTAETKFMIEDEPLFLAKWDVVYFYEKTSLPEAVNFFYDRSYKDGAYNLLKLDETGEITERIYLERPNDPS